MHQTYRLLSLLAICNISYLVALPAYSYATPPPAPSSTSLPVFPGAAGFGASTAGGSGRHASPASSTIVRVSSLEDSGPGTLRACVEFHSPRVCVFEVGGEIALQKKLRIRDPYITIAGQTSPPPGITLTHGTLTVESHDVVIQHLAVRPGDGPGGVKGEERDGISIGTSPPRTVFNVLLDHLSLTWAIDENLDLWYPNTHDVTVQNSIIAEGLDHSIHPKGPHSKGVLIGDGVTRVSLVRNLIAHNIERNPYLKPGSSAEVINNVVYDWGPKGGWSLCNVSDNEGNGVPVLLTLIGNMYKPGPASARVPLLYGKRIAPGTRVFAQGNLGPSRSDDTSDEWTIASIPADPHRAVTPPISSGIQAISAQVAYDVVLRNAGSRPKERNKTDTRIVEEVRSGSGGIKDCVASCTAPAGGWPEMHSAKKTLSLPEKPFEISPAEHNTKSAAQTSGYTKLEIWLQDQARALEMP